ncbi:MAG: Hsp70 family protein, partial [Chloroflexi bacterium]|nr:Hsp70 family protein [Chloroflexota bacterium]
VLGGTPYGAEALMARLLRFIVDEVTKRQGATPERIVISHPANFGPYKKDLMLEMARLADVGDVQFVTEPEAAAINYSRQNRLEAGEVVAVYDFGGGTFDAAVLRRVGDGFEVLGQPEGMERLGGIDFDQAIMAHVDDAVAGQITEADPSDAMTRAALARLRADIRSAKESLSSDTDVTIPVMLPALQTEVRLTRPEFEGMIRPRLLETVSALERAVRSAGIQMSDVSKILLVGGSSRIPLVGEIVQHATGRPVAVDAHPKFAIALGAAAAAAADLGRETPAVAAAPEPVPEPEETAAMPVPTPAPLPSHATAPETAPAAAAPSVPAKRRGVPMIAIALVLLLVGGAAAGAFVFLNRGESATGDAGTSASAAASIAASGAAPAAAGDGGLLRPTFTGDPWQARPEEFRGQNGKRAAYDCPAGGSPGSVYGTDVYTDDSSVCAAGVHTGVITVADGGRVIVEILPGQESYEASTRNGIESIEYQSWGGSFSVVTDVAQAPAPSASAGTGGGAGVITSYAGRSDESGNSGDGGAARGALLYSPSGLAVADDGTLYIVDADNENVRVVAPDGTIGTLYEDADDDGLWNPLGIDLDSDGNVYVADTFYDRIVKITPDGTLTTVAGTQDLSGFGGDGGPATDAMLSAPADVAVGADGTLYIADSFNNRIRVVDPSGTITTLAGTGAPGFAGDSGPAEDAELSNPLSVAVDDDGNVYVADYGNNRLRRIDPSGTITTVAGNGEGEDVPITGGPDATDLPLPGIGEVALDADGNIYTATVRVVVRIAPDGSVTVVAGGGSSAEDGVTATDAYLIDISGLAIDPNTATLYLSDRSSSVRAVEAAGAAS